MAKTFIDHPPILNGTAEQKIAQLLRHLDDMSNKLNEALMTITIEQMTPEAQTVVKSGAQAAEASREGYETLKSLIIKNAEVARLASEELRIALNKQYTAISEQFGEFTQTIDAQVALTAEGIMQTYNVEERLQAVETDTEDFINNISSYIYSGILDPNDPSVVGIAIGYNVTHEDGTLNQQNKMATFTADALTFYVNGSAAAYFSNNVFHIAQGEITDSMRMGNFIWKVLSSGAMGLMKG